MNTNLDLISLDDDELLDVVGGGNGGCGGGGGGGCYQQHCDPCCPSVEIVACVSICA